VTRNAGDLSPHAGSVEATLGGRRYLRRAWDERDASRQSGGAVATLVTGNTIDQ
jgi:hypothetical protein